MTDTPDIPGDPDEAAREALVRRAAAQQAEERQQAFDAEWGERIAAAFKILSGYGITELKGYPGWGQSSAQLTPKLDVVGDASMLSWIVVKLHGILPDEANRYLALRAPWLRPIFQMATHQPITPSGSIETITFSETPVLDALFSTVIPAADADGWLSGMLPEPAPVPEEPSPFAGVLRPVKPAKNITQQGQPE